jgi:hypothetical protein
MGIFIGSLVVDDVVCDVVNGLAVGVKDVVVDIVADVAAVVVVGVVVMHPVNPDRIIRPHTQIPNSHSFFLCIIRSPAVIMSLLLCMPLYRNLFILLLSHQYG